MKKPRYGVLAEASFLTSLRDDLWMVAVHVDSLRQEVIFIVLHTAVGSGAVDERHQESAHINEVGPSLTTSPIVSASHCPW